MLLLLVYVVLAVRVVAAVVCGCWYVCVWCCCYWLSVFVLCVFADGVVVCGC